MERKSYFHRVHDYTPTRFWINNPTDEEASLAINHGAVHCTTNPTYTAKMLADPKMRPKALKWLQQALHTTGDVRKAAVLAQRSAVENLMGHFSSLFEDSRGRAGLVSLQGDPYAEEDPDCIVNEALAGISLGPNYLAKIPVTQAGLTAIDELVRRDIPIIATEIMSMSQVVAACETYKSSSSLSGKTPPFFVTCIAGIFDQCLRMQYDRGEINIEPDILFQAGTLLTRRQYRLMGRQGYPGILLGGGARGPHHFTEFVGGHVHITLNWKDAHTLIAKDTPVINRMDTSAAEYVFDELMRQVPDFKRAYCADGLSPGDYANFAPVALFRSLFIEGWDSLIREIEALKEEMGL